MTMMHTTSRRDSRDLLLDPVIDDLLLRLRGLVLVGDVLAQRGASADELEAHAREAARLRSKLAWLIGGDDSDPAGLAA